MPSATHTPTYLNTDASPASLAPDRAVSLLNMTPELGFMSNVSGTLPVGAAYLPPAGVNKDVGTVSDEEGRSLVLFVWNSAGQHRLLRHNLVNNRIDVLLSAPLLNLLPTDQVCQTGIIGDYLAWLDRDGIQYRINMKAAARGDYAGLTEPYFFRLARPVPLFEPFTSRSLLGFPTNRVKDHDWQFAYRYGYADNDVTVLSPYSIIDRATAGNRLANNIIVYRPINGVPSALVQRIEFFVRKDADVTWRKCATLKRGSDGLFADRFDFNGATFGAPLDTSSASKLVEAIPNRSFALGAADNRFFLANNIAGEPATVVPLVAVAEQGLEAFTIVQTPLYRVKYQYVIDSAFTNYKECYVSFLLVSGTVGQPDARYVNASFNSDAGIYFEVETEAAQQFKTDELLKEARRILEQMTPGVQFATFSQTGFGLIGSVPRIMSGAIQSLKSSSTRQFGIQFYDYAGRTSGTITNPAAIVSVGEMLDYPEAIRNQFVRWTLPALSPQTEIPAWAVAYEIVATANQKYRFFRQFYAAEVLRFKKGADPEKPEFVASGQLGGPLWIDIAPLGREALGYVWQAGSQDRIRLLDAFYGGVWRDYAIIEQRGSYLLVEEPLSINYPRMVRAEIYSEAEQGNGETFFYETGNRFLVNRTYVAGVEQRAYSTVTGIIKGDIFIKPGLLNGIVGIATKLLGRPHATQYYPASDGNYYISTEAAYANGEYNVPVNPAEVETNYFKAAAGDIRIKNYGLYSASTQQGGIVSTAPMGVGGRPGVFEVVSTVPANETQWLNDRGRPSVTLADGPPLPAYRTKSIRWGGVLLPGSQLNGLASFDDEAEVTAPAENGAVTALKLANQLQSQGTVLIAWQETGACSLYLNEAVLTQADGESLRADSSRVVGTVRALSGKRGTIHPASIVAYDGSIWAWSQLGAEVLRYDQSGITRLGKTYGGRKLCRELADKYGTAAIRGGYDPESETYFLTFGATNGLPARTIGFSERGAKGFCGDYSFASSTYATVGPAMYSFKDSLAYRHSQLAARATFYGTTYPLRVGWIANEGVKVSKEWLSLAAHGSHEWTATLLENEQSGGVKQRSRTMASWGRFQLGAFVVALRRDELQPVRRGGVMLTNPDELLHRGNPLQSPWLSITMEATAIKPLRLDAVTINFNYLQGQQPVPQ